MVTRRFRARFEDVLTGLGAGANAMEVGDRKIFEEALRCENGVFKCKDWLTMSPMMDRQVVQF